MTKRFGGIFLLILLSGLWTLGHGASLCFKAKAASFRPNDKVFREIYGSGIYYGGEIDLGLTSNIYLWAGIDYFSKKGKLTFTGEETKIQNIPISAGIGYRFHLGLINPYVGGGLGYFNYKETNPLGTVKEGHVGFMGQGGVLLGPGPFLLDFQAGYSYCKVKPAEVEANLGGLSLALGLGFKF